MSSSDAIEKYDFEYMYRVYPDKKTSLLLEEMVKPPLDTKDHSLGSFLLIWK